MKRFLLILLVWVVGVSAAQNTVLTDHIDQLEQRVMDIRGLTLMEPVDRKFPTLAEAQTTIRALYETELTDDVVHRATQFYRAFDFVPVDFDLRTVYLDLITDQVAGFYDTDAKNMNILLLSGNELGDQLPPLERMTYAHEFTHALQDQHFNLDDKIMTIEAADAALAALALVEGDATLVMQEYMLQVVQEEPALMVQMLGSIAGINTALPPGVPSIMEEELTMPYLRGLDFVTTLHRQGGWEAVNTAYEDLPVSTEQILHPERYLAEDMPVSVTLNESDLGGDWSLLTEDTLGEFYLREFMATRLDAKAAERAAAGWGGDYYRLYYNPENDQRAWVLRLAWDTSDDASEFAQLYEEFAGLRYSSRSDTCWSSDQDATCIITGDEIVLAYAPTTDLARTLIANQE